MQNDMSYPNETRYVTARAVVPCAEFKAGEFVAVKFSHRDNNGVAWFSIDRSQNGPLRSEVLYAKHYLTEFSL